MDPIPREPPGNFRFEVVLKQDLFGRVERGVLEESAGTARTVVRRDLSPARFGVRWIGWLLARREVRALRQVAGVARVPQLIAWDGTRLYRTWIAGRPFQEARPGDPAWFDAARQILEDLHAAGVTHNDLHKEPNLIVTPEAGPAIVDFQLASVHRSRGPWFRMCVREDLRHLLKHKRTCCPEALTDDDHGRLARKSWYARAWELTAKRLYLLVTRRLLGWRDAEGGNRPRSK